jgi:flagellar M-ring protein FliF
VQKFLKQMQEFIAALTPSQKIVLAIAGAAVVAVLALFVKLTQKADFKPLYSGLSAPDAQTVAQRLAARNIPYEVSNDGSSISVPADVLDKTRLDLAAEGMPQTGRLGFELFDKPNWAGSDFSEQVNYQRALEGELERTIQTLGNVESVRVHLVLPHESLFSDRERVAKAAVVMKLRGGGLSDDQTNAVTHLVASAVDSLSPENVTLIGADGRTPLVAKGRETSRGAYAPVELEAAMAEKLVATLSPVVGPDHVKASVTLAYDQSSGETTQETYDPANPVLLSEQVQEEHFGGSPPAGVPGTSSNVPPAPAGGGKKGDAAAAASAAGKPGAAAAPAANPVNPIISVGSDNDGQRSESRTFAVSKTVKHSVDPAGRVQKVAAAILVDDVVEVKEEKGKTAETRHKRTPEEMKQIEELARAAIGFDEKRGDVLSVQNISFLESPVEKVTPPAAVERVRLVAEKWIWVGRYLALALIFAAVYALILKPIRDRVVKSLDTGSANPALAAGSAGGIGAGSGAHAGLSPQEAALLSNAQLQEELQLTNSDVERVIKLKRHLAEKVKRDPAQAGAVLRQWMHEGESQS